MAQPIMPTVTGAIFIIGRDDYVIGDIGLALIVRAELFRRKSKVIRP